MANEAAATAPSHDLFLAWAKEASTEGCNASCRLSSAYREQGTWWEDLELASQQVCWGCDQAPWPHERQYARQVWRTIHDEQLPIRSVSQRCNLWSVPCPTGLAVRSTATRCLVGHFVYGIFCFFRWMGEGQESYALLSLESAMDLASVVAPAPCGASWGFSAQELAVNYERLLAAVYHLHLPVPEYWLPAPETAAGCHRPRAPEPQERPLSGAPLPRARLHCLVLAVWPADKERMAAIVDTYASACDRLVFMTASDAPARFHGHAVVDLRRLFHMSPDVQSIAGAHGAGGAESQATAANTIDKTIRTFHWEALVQRSAPEHEKADVACRLDSDTLFFPENLRRVLACRNFSALEPWALGHANYAHKHQQPGRAFFNGGTGVCLSRAAIERLLVNIVEGGVRWTSSYGDWNAGACVSAPGHWDDVVLGACLAQFGVPLSRWGTDCFRRSLFWPSQLHSAFPGPEQIRPPRLPPKASFFRPPEERTAEDDPVVMNYHVWRYRAWQHLACDHDVWLSNFPIGMHPYRNRTLARRDFAAVTEGHRLGGYTPRLWDGSREQCEDLMC